MRSMAVGSVRSRNNVNIFGDPASRPIMFGHGLGTTQEMWRQMPPEFVDHLVVLFDLVGCGASDLDAYDSTRYDSLHSHADDLLVIIDELDLRDVVFVGHSVSAIVGALAAIREPALFGALVLVGVSTLYVHDLSGGLTDRDDDRPLVQLDSVFMGQGATSSVTDPRRDEIQRHVAQVALLSDHRRDLACIVTPTLVVDETDDPIAPPVGRYLHAAISGSTLVTMPVSCKSSNALATIELAQHIRAYL